MKYFVFDKESERLNFFTFLFFLHADTFVNCLCFFFFRV